MFPIAFRRVAVVLLVIISLSLSVYNLFNLLQTQPKVTDDVSNWESRIQPVKQKLPAGIDYLSYLDDSNLREVRSQTKGELVEFYLTQYALSPIIVRRGVKYPWIIGNFSSKNFTGWLKSSIGAYQIEDLGSGIYLIHRAAQ